MNQSSQDIRSQWPLLNITCAWIELYLISQRLLHKNYRTKTKPLLQTRTEKKSRWKKIHNDRPIIQKRWQKRIIELRESHTWLLLLAVEKWRITRQWLFSRIPQQLHIFRYSLRVLDSISDVDRKQHSTLGFRYSLNLWLNTSDTLQHLRHHLKCRPWIGSDASSDVALVTWHLFLIKRPVANSSALNFNIDGKIMWVHCPCLWKYGV